MVIMIVINALVSAVFIGIGIFAYHKETPMWFYSGSEEEIEKEHFHDITSYNHKNAMMWICYGTGLLAVTLIDAICHVGQFVYLFTYIGYLVFGFIAMIIYWEHLHDRYTKDEIT